MLVGGSGGNISLAQVQAEAQREMMKTASEDKKCSRVARNDQFQKHANMRQQAIDANAEKADKGVLGTIFENIGLFVGIAAAALVVAFCPLAAPVVALIAGLALAGGTGLGKLAALGPQGEANALEKQASELELEATKMQKESEDWASDVQAKQDIIRQSIEVSRTALQNDLKACERVVERS